jgi:rhodanese-related sulfurtransferase
MKKLTRTLVALLALVGLSHAGVTDVSAGEAAKQLKKNLEIVVVDIRTPEEFAQGHLNGAVNINMRSGNFKEQLAKLDRDATYLMHCLSGGRSTASLPVWMELGFEKVLHLDEGMKGWLEEDLPVVVPLKNEKEENRPLPPKIIGGK